MVKDWGYLAAFKQKDLPSLQQMLKHIYETHDTYMIEDINNRFETKADRLSNSIEIQSVNKSDDLMVNAGLQQCINLILGTSSSRYRYLQWGTALNTTAPTTSDTTLENGSPLVGQGILDMNSVNGWIEAVGMRLYFGVIIPQSITTNDGALIDDVSEFGIFTSTGLANMLNHSKFFNNKLIMEFTADLLQAKATRILSVVVEFCPVV